MNKEDDLTRNDKKEKGIKMSEDVSKYGEWVPSFFAWVSPDEQKEKAVELNDATKDENNRKRK